MVRAFTPASGWPVQLTGVNALTTSACCPSSKQPELKHAAVKILKAELPWSMLAVAWLPDAQVLGAREALVQLMRLFPFAACVPFSRHTPLHMPAGEPVGEPSRARSGKALEARSGVLFRAAAHDAPPAELLARIEALLDLDGKDTLRYADRKRGQHRVAKLVRRGDHAELQGFVLAGDTSAEAWIKTVLQDELPAQSYGRLLLVPGAIAPVAVHARGKQICSCFDVTDEAITARLGQCSGDEDTRLNQLQSALKCGTNCGSCLPEVKRMVRASMPVAV